MKILYKIGAILIITATLFSLVSCQKEKNAMIDYGNYKSDGQYVLFGSYPQSIYEGSLEGAEEWGDYYILPTGERFVKATAITYNMYESYDGAEKDGKAGYYEKGDELYFKVEPIRWRIVQNDGNRMLLWCDDIIDTHRFDDGEGTDYLESELYEWLNGDFYTKAFSPGERGIIIPTILSEDADENVFLFSRDEVEMYGIKEDIFTKKPVTNYVQATKKLGKNTVVGGRINKSTAGYRNCTIAYWMRNSENGFVTALFNGGYELNTYNGTETLLGVAPAVWITIK